MRVFFLLLAAIECASSSCGGVDGAKCNADRRGVTAFDTRGP